MEEEKKASNKKVVLVLFVISFVIDFFLTSASYSSLVMTLGGSLVIEEIVEYIISSLMARYSLDIKLDKFDRIVGLLPIPGVTAFGVRCVRMFLKKNNSI